MVPGELVYTFKSDATFLLPVACYTQEEMRKEHRFERMISYVSSGVPCILIETTHPCKVLTTLGIRFIDYTQLLTPEEYLVALNKACRSCGPSRYPYT